MARTWEEICARDAKYHRRILRAALAYRRVIVSVPSTDAQAVIDRFQRLVNRINCLSPCECPVYLEGR